MDRPIIDPPRSRPLPINYPGRHDFVVVASDGVRFNLSRTVLAAASSFFADMFIVGGPSSSTRSSEGQIVNAVENHVVLDSLFAISYSHPEKPAPNIQSFAQIAELIQVAEKYRMHRALDYLSSHLVLPRIQGTTLIQPFTVTHPLVTLSLSLTQGFSLPARLALKEVVGGAANSIWGTTLDDDAELDGFTLDRRMLKKIHRMRKSRTDAYTRFIQGLRSCGCNSTCMTCIEGWKAHLLKKFEEAPNSAAFSVAFNEGRSCSRCRQSLVTLNSREFGTFITSQAAEERTLPELR